MTAPSLWERVGPHFGPYRAQLRFSLRVALAALLAFDIAQVLTIPLHGLWAVLTAVVVTQMSIGASIRATAEYVVGTLGGVIYASAVAVVVPHPNTIALAGLVLQPGFETSGRLGCPDAEIKRDALCSLGLRSHGPFCGSRKFDPAGFAR